jgi:hypothetical protein
MSTKQKQTAEGNTRRCFKTLKERLFLFSWFVLMIYGFSLPPGGCSIYRRRPM